MKQREQAINQRDIQKEQKLSKIKTVMIKKIEAIKEKVDVFSQNRKPDDKEIQPSTQPGKFYNGNSKNEPGNGSVKRPGYIYIIQEL